MSCLHLDNPASTPSLVMTSEGSPTSVSSSLTAIYASLSPSTVFIFHPVHMITWNHLFFMLPECLMLCLLVGGLYLPTISLREYCHGARIHGSCWLLFTSAIMSKLAGQLTELSCRARTWEFNSVPHLLGEEPVYVTMDKLHSLRAPLEEVNGKPILCILSIENPGKGAHFLSYDADQYTVMLILLISQITNTIFSLKTHQTTCNLF